MIKHILFFAVAFLTPYLSAQEGEVQEKQPASEYPPLDERFLEELRRQDQEQETVGEKRFYQEFLYMLFVLGLIVVAMFLISWAMKKMMYSRVEQMNLTNLIKVLERRDLSQKSALYLIEINGKGTLIAETQQGVTALGDVDLASQGSTFKELTKQ